MAYVTPYLASNSLAVLIGKAQTRGGVWEFHRLDDYGVTTWHAMRQGTQEGSLSLQRCFSHRTFLARLDASKFDADYLALQLGDPALVTPPAA